jgi:hypothetical protein
MAFVEPPLSKAAVHCDIDALSEILSAGVDVDHTDDSGCYRNLTPLQLVCCTSAGKREARVACAALLLAHGASPNAGAPGNPGQSTNNARHFTVLMKAACRVRHEIANLEIVQMLLSAGSDVNVLIEGDDKAPTWSALSAAMCFSPFPPLDPRGYDAVVEALLKAGADANPAATRGGTVMDFAIAYGRRRIWPLLLRAGSILPTGQNPYREDGYDDHRTHPYLQKLDTAGGWKAYEKAHRTRLLATFKPKFTHLVPEELVPLIVEFSFHVGFY